MMTPRIKTYVKEIRGKYSPSSLKNDSWQFIKQFFTSPMQTGSIAPSSRILAKAMSTGLWERDSIKVVEYGPGTGALTKRIVPQMPIHSSYSAIEINPQFASSMRKKFSQIEVIDGSAEDVRALVGHADIIISGLPFFNLPIDFGERVLEETFKTLSKDGFFRTFMYLPTYNSSKMRQWRSHAKKFFPYIETNLVALNFPPAVVVTMHKSPPRQESILLPNPITAPEKP